MPRGNDTERLETEHSMPLIRLPGMPSYDLPMRPAGGRRRDARENRERVIDAGIDLLMTDSGATVQDIADHSGLGRTTVYRHFPSREKLFEALMQEVMNRSREEVAAVAGDGLPAAETLRSVGRLNVELGVRYRFLYENQDVTVRPIQSHTRQGPTWMDGFLSAARDRGEIRADMPTWWLTATALSLTMAMVADVLAGRIDEEAAGTVLGNTLVAAVMP